MAHRPIRTCVGCGVRSPQSEQLRICKKHGGEVVLDPSGVLPGRGAWIHLDDKCINGLRKSQGLLMRSLHGATDLERAFVQLRDISNDRMVTTGKRVGS